MKIHVLTLLITRDCETQTEVIGAYRCPFKAEEEGNELVARYEEDRMYLSYEIQVLQMEVK